MKVNSMMCLTTLKERLGKFSKNESGAVTVDFVVLTAGVVFLGSIATLALAPKVTAKLASISLN